MDTNYTAAKNHGPLAMCSLHTLMIYPISTSVIVQQSSFLSEYVQLQYVEVFQTQDRLSKNSLKVTSRKYLKTGL